MSTAPHQWPRKPNEGCSSSKDACQGNWPSFVYEPAIIFAVREPLGSSVDGWALGSLLGGRVPQSGKKSKC